MDGEITEHVKASEILATVATASPFAAWIASHIDALHAALRTYSLIVGAIGGTFAMLFWLRRWLRKDKCDRD